MTAFAYYNEFDKYAAAWLRNLIAKGLIAPGEVDERDIRDVHSNDLRGFRQVHMFAGLGGWSYAMRLAGWPDDREVWTGSAPCQPFSVAGAQRGSADERHLWPAFFNLIRECRPSAVFGEQVAGAAGVAWWDHVAADLEGAGYAVAAANLGAHSVGSPHIRQRLYWVAKSNEREWGSWRLSPEQQNRSQLESARRSDIGIVAHSDGGHASAEREQCGGQQRQQQEDGGAGCIDMGNSCSQGLQEQRRITGISRGEAGTDPRQATERAGALDAWNDIEWIECSDGKYRPVGAGIFPLAARLPKGLVRGGDRSMAPDANDSSEARVMRLHGYGNAIVPQLAAAFVRAAFGYTG